MRWLSPAKLLHPLAFPVLILLGGLIIASSPGCENAETPRSENSQSETSTGPEQTPSDPPLDNEDPLFDPEDGFRMLSMKDFAVMTEGDPQEHPWNAIRQRIICTGEPRGYLYTKEPFSNFTLRVEFRYPATMKKNVPPTPPNTGFLIYGQEPHKIWPACLEVQGRYDEIAHIKSNSRDIQVEVKDNPQAREQARKPATEWNQLEIVSKDGALTSYLNGVQVAESQPTELKSGFIGLQSERFTVHFRYLRIRVDESR